MDTFSEGTCFWIVWLSFVNVLIISILLYLIDSSNVQAQSPYKKEDYRKGGIQYIKGRKLSVFV
jgi:hypothetical protein